MEKWRIFQNFLFYKDDSNVIFNILWNVDSSADVEIRMSWYSSDRENDVEVFIAFFCSVVSFLNEQSMLLIKIRMIWNQLLNAIKILRNLAEDRDLLVEIYKLNSI